MKLAYIYTSITTTGGVDRILTVKANYFAEEMGYEVYVITDSQAGKPLTFPLSPKVKHIDLGINFMQQYRCKNIASRFLCYRRLMKLYKQRLTTLLTELHCDVVCTTCGRDLDFLTTINDGSKKVGEIHCIRRIFRNLHWMEAKGFPHRLIAKFWRHKNEQAIKMLDTFVVLTRHDAETWSAVRQCVVIPNPNTIECAEPSTTESKRIISVGRLSEEKGFERLVEAWALIAKNHPDWHVDIYGEGQLHGFLSQRIKDLGVQDSFHLQPPTKKIAKEYCRSAFYVMSSRYEGFGLVLTEAMSCGLPCVSFDCPHGPCEIIRNEEDGILVPEGNIQALAAAMKLLIENPELRQSMGIKAKHNIARYSKQEVMNKWIDLFEK